MESKTQFDSNKERGKKHRMEMGQKGSSNKRETAQQS